jgi:hypothetical protein
VIRDVIDIIKQVKDFQDDGGDSLTKKLLKPSSPRPTVFKNASGMIAYFPILTSETTNFELLEKVRIGFEAEYASYLSLAINATSSLGEDSTTKAGDLIKRVHTNELPSKGLNIPYDGVRALLDESVRFESRTLSDDLNLELLEAFGNGNIARVPDASLKWPGSGPNGTVTAADLPNAANMTADEIQKETTRKNRG